MHKRLDLGDVRYTGLFVGQGFSATLPLLGSTGSTSSVYGDLRLYNAEINYANSNVSVYGANNMANFFDTTSVGSALTGIVHTYGLPIEPRNRVLDMFNLLNRCQPSECFELKECKKVVLPKDGGVFKLNVKGEITLDKENSIVFEGSECDVYYVHVHFNTCNVETKLAIDYGNLCDKVVNFGCVRPENVFWFFTADNNCVQHCDNYCLAPVGSAVLELLNNNVSPCVEFLGNLLVAPNVSTLVKSFNLQGRLLSFGSVLLDTAVIRIPCCFDVQPTLANLHCDLEVVHKELDDANCSLDALKKDTSAINCALGNVSDAFSKLVKYLTHRHHKHSHKH